MSKVSDRCKKDGIHIVHCDWSRGGQGQDLRHRLIEGDLGLCPVSVAKEQGDPSKVWTMKGDLRWFLWAPRGQDSGAMMLRTAGCQVAQDSGRCVPG